MRGELEERLWEPFWGREVAQDQAVGFFSPKHEAYRPLGKLAAVKPLLSTLTQRFPSTLRSLSLALSPAAAVPPLSLKPETSHRTRFSFPLQRQRDSAAKTLKLEIRRSEERVLGVKSGIGLMKTLENRIDICKMLLLKQKTKLSAVPLSSSVLQRETNRSLAEKLCFYDESRTFQLARSYRRRLETQHLPWEEAETLSVPQSPERETNKEVTFQCTRKGQKYGFSQSAQSSPHPQLHFQSRSHIEETKSTANSPRRRAEGLGSRRKAESSPVSPRGREISKMLANSQKRKGRLRRLVALYFGSSV